MLYMRIGLKSSPVTTYRFSYESFVCRFVKSFTKQNKKNYGSLFNL